MCVDGIFVFVVFIKLTAIPKRAISIYTETPFTFWDTYYDWVGIARLFSII